MVNTSLMTGPSKQRIPSRPYTAKPGKVKRVGKRPRTAICPPNEPRRPTDQRLRLLHRHEQLQKRLIIQAGVLAKRHNLRGREWSQSKEEGFFDPEPNAAECTRTVVQAFKNEDEFLRYANEQQICGNDWCFTALNQQPLNVDSVNATEGNTGKESQTTALFEAVVKHAGDSVLLSNTSAKQMPLPDRFSVVKVLQSLEQIGTVKPDLLSITRTMLMILVPALFHSPDEPEEGDMFDLNALEENQVRTHWERVSDLERELEALRTVAVNAEAELAALKARDAGKSVDDLISQVAEGVSSLIDSRPKIGIIKKTARALDISFDREWYCSLFPSSTLTDMITDSVKHVDEPEGLVRIVEAALNRSEDCQLISTVFERNPLVERQCIIEQRPAKLRAFWEHHYEALYNILWTSTDLIENMIRRRPELYGKVLHSYVTSLKTDRGAKRAWALHRHVMQEILSEFARHDTNFIHELFNDNVHAVRSFFEHNVDEGHSMLRDLACSSKAIVETTITASQDLLAAILTDKTQWLADIAKECPLFLLNLGRQYPAVFSSIFTLDSTLLPHLCREKPSILNTLPSHAPDALVSCITKGPKLLFKALGKLKFEEQVDGYKATPEILLEDACLLQQLGLVNAEVYRSRCCDGEAQTMVIQSKTKAIKPQALVDIIGRKRVKNGTAGEHDELIELIGNVYASKVKCDQIDLKAGHPLDPLPEVLNDYVSEHVKDLTPKKALVNVATTVRKFAGADEYVYWFGVMIGVVNPDTFNSQSYTFFFSILRNLLPHDQYNACLQRQQVWLPLSKISAAVLDAMDSMWNDQDAKQTIFRHLNELPQAQANRSDLLHGWCSTEYVRQKQQESSQGKPLLASAVRQSMFQVLKEAKLSQHNPTIDCVKLDEALNVVMRCWAEADEAIVKRLVDLYTLADTNGDGILDFDEFKALVLMVDPTAQDRTIRRLFKVTGKTVDGDSQEQSISPMDFVDVMRTQNINFANLPSKT